MKRGKFGSVKTVVDGRTFHSKLEAARYSQLRLLERAGEITNLECQPRFPITVNGQKIGTFVGDFRYFTRPTDTKRGEYILEDVKGYRTDLYRWKKKLVEALYPGTKIVEITA